MENSWQNKCTSSWTSIPTPSQQGARNQIEMSAGSFAHPYVTQEVSSVSSGFVRQPMIFNNSNLGSCTSGNPELGNSFLSLLSGPSSQLQRGVQSMPSSISFLNSSKLPTQKDNIVSGGDSYGVPLAPVALLSPQLGNHNMRTGTDHFLVVPSRASSTSSPRFPDMHSMQQMTNVTYNSEINQTGLHPLTRGNEMGTDLFYPRQGWLSSLNLPNGQHSSTNIQPSLNVPSVTKSATSGPESSFAKGCPRVFCLATNGELLLNNKGLLGVVCLCHGFQMSISKFCEHSGSCIVNPGDAVRLESGETVSQWRRMYFPKYGIRVPDDNSGWDWPERNPATVGLMNRKATVLNTSKNSDMFKVVDQSVAPTRSRQYRNKFASQNNSRIGESVMENTFSDVMNNVRHRNTQGECKVPLKSLAGTAQTILSAPEDIQTMHIVKGGPRSIGSEKAREETGYQSISDYIDFLTKGGDTLIANHQSLGNFRFRGTGSDVSNGNDSRECIVERDGISSNIELRLGQPSQHRYNLEGSVISAMQSPPFVAYNIHQKSQDPIFHNAVIPSVTEESRQHLQSVPSNASNSQRWDESKFTFKQLVPGNHAEAGQFKGDITKSSHKLFSNSNILSEGNVMSRASDNMINFSGTSMSRALPGESHGTSGPFDFPRNRSGAEGNSFFHNTQLAGSSPFSGVFSHSRLASDTTLDGKQSPYWCHLLGVPPDASNTSNQSNLHGNASFIQRKSFLDQAPLRAVNSSTVSSGSGVPLSEVSCFSSTNSIYRPTLMRMSNKESVDVSPHFLDENLRLLALRRTLDLKQKHVVSNDMEREQGRVCIPSTVEMQQRTSIIGSVAPEELKEGPYLTIKKDNPEFGAKQLQKCSNRFVDGNFEKSAGVTGVKKWCNFLTSSHDIGHPQDPLIDNQPLPSLGRIISNAVKTSEHDVCRQREPSPFFTGNCSCAVHSEDFVGSCVIRGEVPDDANKTHFGRIIGSTSKPVPSIFDNDHIVQHKTSTLNGFENLNRQIRVQNECHASQWRDVPSKRIRVENATCIEKPTELFDAINVEAQVVGTAGKNATQQAESLNEQQMSNMYSGCSAPVVTEVTGEVNTRDSWTVDAGNNRYTSEHVVDEGSGIERCWSSDDAHGSERSTETVNVSHKHDSTRGGKSSSYLPSLSLQGRACDFRLERSFGLKKVQQWHPTKCSGNESIGKKQPSKSNFQVRKRKKTIKWKRLDASFPASGLSSVQYDSPQSVGDTESHSCSSRGTQILSKLGHGWKRTCGVHANQSSRLKQKCSTVLSAKTLSRKRNICELADHHREGQDGCRKQMKDDSNHLRKSKSSSEKKSKKRGAPDLSEQLPNMEMSKRDAGKLPKYSSMNHAKVVSSNQADTIDKKTKPVVCGEFGIISSGKLGEDPIKLAKIVSLSTVLRTARICSTEEPGVGSTVKTKKKCFKRSSECYGKLSILEDEGMGSEYYSIVMKNKELAGNFMFETKMPTLSEDNTCVDELSMPGKDEICADDRTLKHSTPSSGAPLKSRFKEARKRSLYELAGKAVDLSNSSCLPTKAPKRALRSTFKSHRKSFLKKVDGDSKCHRGGFSQRSNIKSVKKQQKDQPYTLDSDAFCSVCGSSKKDDDNCLLECSTCLIRVHQACYGIARVPKVRWSCRPCRGDSRHNVCVLCGYEGGAMTQALKSRNIVKGLLEAWSITLESKSKKFSPLSETSKDELRLSDTSGDEDELYSDHGTRPVIQQSPSAMLVEDSLDKMDIVQPSNDIPSILQVHNSITAGIGDPTIKQWVHMVCGLWTPSTRCPNVDTMSAFDVSGVLRPPMNVVCSMCNRPGGSCIQCRVVSCSVHFHPWCAHQKGLLQSEVEGVDNDKVGFYGRCMLHATQQNSDSVIRLIDSDLDSLGKEEFSCARTEGYKGRKKDGFRHKLHGRSNVNGECVVPQEQIDAWLHINGQKSCARGILKSQTSDIENDCRKEYARYKQAIGWKNLVVYKSGIHGLGLYTSQFISRGAMVVEYVGEIVGLRVADKREVEYQSGRKLQYKGACYFFRIDKEHIIDATRKGGIARFVNHSCLPNCVAKIISPRNEKKVVFFAERDIYPGEEVTYDYHFNHEDEGEKIPCFCNSKNCRRFLN